MPSTKRVKPKPLREVLEKILTQLQRSVYPHRHRETLTCFYRRDQYLFFAQPVSSADVPDYYEYIKEPMDFATMQTKLEEGHYTTLDGFKNDMLLVTGNAQYFNSINGPSAIIHTEAKKLEEWGLKNLSKEAPAVVDTITDQEKSKPTASLAKKAPKLNIKLKKGSAQHGSLSSTPRTLTPSGLQNEIKLEDESLSDNEWASSQEENVEDDEYEDDQEEIEDDEDEDDDDDDDNESTRDTTNSFDESFASSARNSPGPAKKPRRSYRPTQRKRQQRPSAIAALLSIPGKDGGDGTVAPISSANGTLVSQIPLTHALDGSIDLGRLTSDEKASLLQASGAGRWPDLLRPFVQSTTPLNTDLLGDASSLAKDWRYIVDGLGAAISSSPQPLSASTTYNLVNRFPEYEKLPFQTTSGYMFNKHGTTLPLAWPRLIGTISTRANNNDSSLPNSLARPKLKERDREDIGAANLDDWTHPRPYQARLTEHDDLGVYPGLLPQAWVHHIVSQKGGPEKSRLPPFYLTANAAFANAIADEMASLPSRLFMGTKSGSASSALALPAASPLDVVTAIEMAESRGWNLNSEEFNKAGVRGCDILREAIYGGALGEAYASSIESFVQGASQHAEDDTYEDDIFSASPVDQKCPPKKRSKTPEHDSRQAPSYFDASGEMHNPEAYIGYDIIPPDIRKESGVSRELEHALDTFSSSRETSPRGLKRARSESENTPAKAQTPIFEPGLLIPNVSTFSKSPPIESLATAHLRGTILDRRLVEYVKENIIIPLTGGLLRILDTVSPGLMKNDNFDPMTLSHEEGSTLGSCWAQHFPDESLKRETSQSAGPSPMETVIISQDISFDLNKVQSLVEKLIHRSYYQAKSQLFEMSRAQSAPVQLDALVRSREELENVLSNTTENGTDLTSLAKDIITLSDEWTSNEDPKMVHALDQLRHRYLRLIHRMPLTDLRKGQWTARIESARKQHGFAQKAASSVSQSSSSAAANPILPPSTDQTLS